MATAIAPAQAETKNGETYVLFDGAGWEFYDALDAWAGDRAGVRIIYIDGDVELFMGITRRHDWITARAGDLIWALADATGLRCEDAGQTTYREQARAAGAQADQTCYFGANAERMAGPKDVAPGVDPVPDLAVEVEVGNPVKRALADWARLGVPEVWHVDAEHEEIGLRILRLAVDGASYSPVTRSGVFPIDDAEVLGLIRSAVAEGAQPWRARLAERVGQIVAGRRVRRRAPGAGRRRRGEPG
jgi:Uma2 family endonuclease